jgi:two-component system catabolic regulation response regulator CreB/two-component system response regulator ChvI
MLVDDEPDIATTIKKGLERDGFTVDAFTKPREALDHFKPDYYAMVITDLKMPDMNGFELYREMKKKDYKIKIAFMTAFEIYETEFHKVFKNTEVKLFFKKPVRISDLVARMKEELAHNITFL